MNELTTDHYRALLGLDADWRVINVELLPKAKLVDIRIEYCRSKLFCPECKCSCPRADMAPERIRMPGPGTQDILAKGISST